ncbi:hypothetical protein L1987_51262 [Smallanthus sonchifolius]|uniref:Uncharacterized protein n=1 Tax=Smallanthus sonchifolius TaxID=185202 RepID=A0ACB9EPV7_9ASTR|nr:hypothetical protein L1987_51262 [Smallanthus sonchifolius]
MAELCGQFYNLGDDTEQANGKIERQQLASVSTALLLAVGIGLFEGLALYFGQEALGAPAVVLSLALEGVFRGFKHTKTPVICLGA